MSWRCGFIFCALVLAGSALCAREESPPATPDKKASAADAPPLMPPAGAKTDPWKLPGGAVLEISSEKYQELLEEIARLRANGGKPPPPTRCRLLKGHIEGGFVLFTAEFSFHADRADAVYALACSQAKALAAQQQDGRTPMLSSDANGFFVQVDKPGDYVVNLDLSLPLNQRTDGSRGFELDLPRAAVTALEIDLPADVRALRLGGKDVAETSLSFKSGRLEGVLGAEPLLALTWRGAPPAGVSSLLSARGRAVVRVEPGWINTELEWVLRAAGAPARQWVLDVPAGAELKTTAADPSRLQINRAEEGGGLRYTILLKEPSDEDLNLTATVRTPSPPGKRAFVGPFLVRGASRQSGVVLVHSAAADSRLLLQPGPELTPREPTDEERRADPGLTAAYEYTAGSAKTPWLEVEVGSAHVAVKVQTVHALTLGRTGSGGALEWQEAVTMSAASPLRAGIDHVDVQMPPECEQLDGASGAGGLLSFDKETRVLHVPFGPDQGGFSAGSFKARYRFPPPGATRGPASVTLPLPRPLQVGDGGARVEVMVPEDVELLPTGVAETKEAHKLTWRLAQNPEQVVVSLQPFSPEIRVYSVIDITFRGPTAQVKHELRLHFPRAAPKQITVKAPAVVAADVQILGGVTLATPAAESPEARTIMLPAAGQEQVVTLQYSFAANSSPLPLATVVGAAGGETKVRLWCDAGPLPTPPGGAWLDQNIEEVAGVNRLPVLVLKATQPDAPLALHFGDPSGASATVLVDRALIRASLASDLWTIHASYVLRQLGEANLDVQLPGPPSALQLHVTLDGRQVDWQPEEAADQTDPNWRIARLRLAADLVKRPAVLDVAYQVSPGRGAAGVVQTTLTPPRLVGDPGQAPTRWEVTLPSGWLALGPEAGAAAPWTAVLQNLLLTPQPAISSAELERWLAGPEVAARGGENSAPNIVCWNGAGEPLVVSKVWQPFWLLVCSLSFLAFGLRLFVLARQAAAGRKRAAFWFWCTALAVVPALAAAWALRPTFFYALVYGCEPGAAVLLAVLAGQCLMLERYRRQIVFLPNFRRARTGSSLLRINGVNLPAGEPSTVDVPRAPSGSHRQG